MQPSGSNRRAGNCQLKMLLLRCECGGGAGMLSLHSGSVVVLECYHFTVEVWWCWNVITSQCKCGGAGMLSLHNGSVVVLECYHFTVEVWWCWNVITSLWICGDAGMLALHCGCVVVLKCWHHCGCVVALQRVPPIPLIPNTFTFRIRTAIGKCLHEFEYRPEV